MSGRDLGTPSFSPCTHASLLGTPQRKVQIFWIPRWPSCLSEKGTAGMRQTLDFKFTLTPHPCVAANLEIFPEGMDLVPSPER